jgi:hypothetical protein
MEKIKNNLIEKLNISPIAMFDLSECEINITKELIQEKIIIKFIDNGNCNYPLSTFHRDAYYIKLS